MNDYQKKVIFLFPAKIKHTSGWGEPLVPLSRAEPPFFSRDCLGTEIL